MARNFKAVDVVEVLADLFLTRGFPRYIRSDNGPEFIAAELRAWLYSLGVSTLFIKPGSHWENGYIESFNGKFRDEFLSGELFDTLSEARVLTERWREVYNSIRPHSALGYRPPAPESFSRNTLTESGLTFGGRSIGGSDKVTVNNWYASGDHKIDQIETGDSYLVESRVAQLAQAHGRHRGSGLGGRPVDQ